MDSFSNLVDVHDGETVEAGHENAQSAAVNRLEVILTLNLPKAAVRLATAAALGVSTLTSSVLTAASAGSISVDGVTPLLADRVLVKDESGPDAHKNGIYVVTAGHGVSGVGAAAFGISVGVGVAFGDQGPSGAAGGNGTPSTGWAGAGPVGGDDGNASTKNGQGGGTGKNTSTDCMTAAEHAASIGRGVVAGVGTGPQDCPPDYGGWWQQIFR